MQKLRLKFSSLETPRLFGWLVFTAVLLLIIWLLYPQQFLVSLYKLSLVTVAGVVGYWLDRGLFPYARPHTFLDDELEPDSVHCQIEPDSDHMVVGLAASKQQSFAASMIRRALIVGCAMLAMGLGA